LQERIKVLETQLQNPQQHIPYQNLQQNQTNIIQTQHTKLLEDKIVAFEMENKFLKEKITAVQNENKKLQEKQKIVTSKVEPPPGLHEPPLKIENVEIRLKSEPEIFLTI